MDVTGRRPDHAGQGSDTAAADPSGTVHRCSLDAPDHDQTIDDRLLQRLHTALDTAEADPRCRVLLLTSAPGVFSTGMNLDAAAGAPTADTEAGGAFYDLLTRFTRAPLIVAAAVDGKVAGGGVGLTAAADLTLATPRSTFALPEALWGLLPCCVLPFLIRRVGFQKAYSMALTTWPLPAADAARCGLVDDLTDSLHDTVRRLAFRTARLSTSTLGSMKRYAGELWPLGERTRAAAIGELTRLMALPDVRRSLTAYAEHRRFPWET
ncbi:enoyl-CoA hydratase-related protein [Streptomyces canus]|uniref:enoyl-CoA hydratase-related protein n=1 Tax=Streptomyces canus TaxID=58343 RepID=UPI0033A57515